MRIPRMLADQRLGAVIGRAPPTSFDIWLKDYLGDSLTSALFLRMKLVPDWIEQRQGLLQVLLRLLAPPCANAAPADFCLPSTWILGAGRQG